MRLTYIFVGGGGGGAICCIFSVNTLTTTALCGGGGCLHSTVWAEFMESVNAIPFI